MGRFLATEFIDLYESFFGTKPHVAPESHNDRPPKTAPSNLEPEVKGKVYDERTVWPYSVQGTPSWDRILGVDIWLPTTLTGKGSDGKPKTWQLPYCVFNIMGSSSWIKTPLAERRGSVKELYSIDDYKITLKGFFIDQANRFFPTSDLETLRTFHEKGLPLQLHNAAIDIFLSAFDMVVIESFDLMAVTGGKRHNRPFSMSLVSDSVFTLESE